MNGRDSRDDHLFLWCAFLILVFVVLPALYIAHADSVNRPLLALAKAQIQVFAPFSRRRGRRGRASRKPIRPPCLGKPYKKF